MNLDYLLKNTTLTYQDLLKLDKGVSLEALEIARRAFPNSVALQAFYQFKMQRANGQI